MKQIPIFLVSVMVIVLFTGCAKPPTEEMNRATEAVTRAENDNDTITYAANTLSRAKDALAKMNAEANSKRYDTAKSFAVEAYNTAERAMSEGRAGAIRVRDEAAALVSQLPPMVAETSQGLNAARAAGLPLNFDTLDSEFTTASNNADKAQTAFSGNQYHDAIDLGKSARTGLNDINQQLSNAAATVRRK